MTLFSKKLTLFEGVDGSGKSTAAKAYAEATGARYVHLGPFKGVTAGLARFYVEAMLPAVLGYQDVVMDRCWLSEKIYGEVHRAGNDRLDDLSRRMLERLALRCGAVVIYCDPGWDAVRQSFRRRASEELLDGVESLSKVYERYLKASMDPDGPYSSGLNCFSYNYLKNPGPETSGFQYMAAGRQSRHLLSLASAGNWDGQVILVGESFAEHKGQDPLYQWPFASFTGLGCSGWLTDQLRIAEVAERDILWVNADQDLSLLPWNNPQKLHVALGDVASNKLGAHGVPHTKAPHPQNWKRFHAAEAYPLVKLLQERK